MSIEQCRRSSSHQKNHDNKACHRNLFFRRRLPASPRRAERSSFQKEESSRDVSASCPSRRFSKSFPSPRAFDRSSLQSSKHSRQRSPTSSTNFTGANAHDDDDDNRSRRHSHRSTNGSVSFSPTVHFHECRHRGNIAMPRSEEEDVAKHCADTTATIRAAIPTTTALTARERGRAGVAPGFASPAIPVRMAAIPTRAAIPRTTASTAREMGRAGVAPGFASPTTARVPLGLSMTKFHNSKQVGLRPARQNAPLSSKAAPAYDNGNKEQRETSCKEEAEREHSQDPVERDPSPVNSLRSFAASSCCAPPSLVDEALLSELLQPNQPTTEEVVSAAPPPRSPDAELLLPVHSLPRDLRKIKQACFHATTPTTGQTTLASRLVSGQQQSSPDTPVASAAASRKTAKKAKAKHKNSAVSSTRRDDLTTARGGDGEPLRGVSIGGFLDLCGLCAARGIEGTVQDRRYAAASMNAGCAAQSKMTPAAAAAAVTAGATTRSKEPPSRHHQHQDQDQQQQQQQQHGDSGMAVELLRGENSAVARGARGGASGAAPLARMPSLPALAVASPRRSSRCLSMISTQSSQSLTSYHSYSLLAAPLQRNDYTIPAPPATTTTTITAAKATVPAFTAESRSEKTANDVGESGQAYFDDVMFGRSNSNVRPPLRRTSLLNSECDFSAASEAAERSSSSRMASQQQQKSQSFSSMRRLSQCWSLHCLSVLNRHPLLQDSISATGAAAEATSRAPACAVLP